jgi:hypothetical protein
VVLVELPFGAVRKRRLKSLNKIFQCLAGYSRCTNMPILVELRKILVNLMFHNRRFGVNLLKKEESDLSGMLRPQLLDRVHGQVLCSDSVQ